MVEWVRVFRTASDDRLSGTSPRHRFRAVVAIALTLGLSAMSAAVTPTVASAQASPRDAATIEAEFVAGVNALRTSNSLAPFVQDSETRSVAMAWTVKMADAGGISHNPNLAKEITASWRKLGENVGTGGDAASVQEAFEASIGHRRNLLDPEFTHIAITVVVRGEWIYVTQQFRTPGQSTAPASAGTPTALALVAPTKTGAKAASVKSVRTRRTVRSISRV